MGNVAVITTKENFENNGVGVYLYWNGGRDSVEAFLKYCEMHDYRSPSNDNYGWSYLTTIIGNFFGDGSSVGVDTINHLYCDNGDNGVYIIEGWKIVDRKFFEGTEQNSYDMNEMLKAINDAQPKKIKFPDELFTSETVPTSSLKVGDKVFMFDNLYSNYSVQEVIGIGEDKWVNGHKVLGIPYVDKYGKDDPSSNPNNYIFSEKIVISTSVNPVE